MSTKRWELNDAQRETTARAGKGVKAALGVVKALFFGTDDEAKEVLTGLAEGVSDQVEARRARGGAIDVEGETVGEARPRPPAAASSTAPAVRVRCACGASQALERRGRKDDALVMVYADMGWRRRREGGWCCPGCAQRGGGHG